MKYILFFHALVGFLLVGCSFKVDENMMIGAYAINVRAESNVIQLEKNGVYRHIFRTNNGSLVSETNSWQLEIIEGRPTVALRNFKCDIDGVNAPGSGYFLLSVTPHRDKYRLWVSRDKNIYFNKIDREYEK